MLPQKDGKIFTWNGIQIQQHPAVFPIGTDALLLGSWVPKIIENKSTILDAGTGTGIIALMMAYAFNGAFVTAIDADVNAIRLAQSNFQNAEWKDQLRIIHEDIFSLDKDEDARFDLIVSNPPFFHKQLDATKVVMLQAKHTQRASGIWIKAFKLKLKSKGEICIIVPSETASSWIQSANETGLYVQHRVDVFSFRKEHMPVRSLLHFGENIISPQNKQLSIYDKPQHYTEEYRTFVKIRDSVNPTEKSE